MGPRKPSLHLDLGAVAGAHEELPPVAALFLIHFDTKKGYNIAWSRTANGVDLDGVEFKSLPSGLHNLKEDLVYFVHGPYAGTSAFLNVAAGAEERGALMVSAGVLVPLSYGRLGRCWRHADGLKKLAQRYTEDPTSYQPFEDYYAQHHRHGDSPVDEDSHLPPPFLDRLRSGSISESRTHVVPGQKLSQHHPALSLGDFMDTFGPLAFPIYRAALARKRILLVSHAPVETACNYVYDISILSNIPLSVSDQLPTEPTRLKPLFNIGVHDIPLLEAEAKARLNSATTPASDDSFDDSRGAWVACTTDEILCMKKSLWDVIIRLPAPHSKQAKEKVWPQAEDDGGLPIKATQRDLRRYRALTKSLKNRYRRKTSLFLDDEDDAEGQAIIRAPGEIDTEAEEPNNIEEVCEKLTWREIAVASFMWWASAGDSQRNDAEQDDGRLLLDMEFIPSSSVITPGDGWRDSTSPEGDSDTEDTRMRVTSSSSTSSPTTTRRRRRPSVVQRRSTNLRQEGVGSEEMDLIAYFHRMTHRILAVLAENIAAVEQAQQQGGDRDELGDEEEEQLLDTEQVVQVSLEDVQGMGLDRYSDKDAEMVRELVARWWGREVVVERGRISCCGVECG
ncbi:hypothetical protein BZA77DRAFT_38063 [Pyronema omphalodes]|nr:hypothetical protein BZA77DRAFT_38063 [Pyronema omphalodes]